MMFSEFKHDWVPLIKNRESIVVRLFLSRLIETSDDKGAKVPARY